MSQTPCPHNTLKICFYERIATEYTFIGGKLAGEGVELDPEPTTYADITCADCSRPLVEGTWYILPEPYRSYCETIQRYEHAEFIERELDGTF
jgi:hypothetical protein